MQKNGITFVQLARNNVDALSMLKVRAAEKHLVTANPEWIAQAAFEQVSATFGVFENDVAVGLISLVDPRLFDDEADREDLQTDCLYVWRVMMDQHHRGKGLGTAAMNFVRDYAVLLGLQGVSLTTKDREAANALAFYEGLNFKPTGRRLDGEIELVWRVANK